MGGRGSQSSSPTTPPSRTRTGSGWPAFAQVKVPVDVDELGDLGGDEVPAEVEGDRIVGGAQPFSQTEPTAAGMTSAAIVSVDRSAEWSPWPTAS